MWSKKMPYGHAMIYSHEPRKQKAGFLGRKGDKKN